MTIPNLVWRQQLKTVQERDLGLKGDIKGGKHCAEWKRQTFAFTPTTKLSWKNILKKIKIMSQSFKHTPVFRGLSFAARCVSRYSEAPAGSSVTITIQPLDPLIRSKCAKTHRDGTVTARFSFVKTHYCSNNWPIKAAGTHLGCRRPRVHDQTPRSSSAFPAKRLSSSPKMPSAWPINAGSLDGNVGGY